MFRLVAFALLCALAARGWVADLPRQPFAKFNPTSFFQGQSSPSSLVLRMVATAEPPKLKSVPAATAVPPSISISSTFLPPLAGVESELALHSFLKTSQYKNEPPVFAFGGGARRESEEGKDYKYLKSLLGGKGLNLYEMSELGLDVPPGLTITTQICANYLKLGRRLPAGVWNEILLQVKTLENTMGKSLGSSSDPLLVSVRSGAAISMPGMMDTVLNLGLNDVTVEALAAKTDNKRFAYDSYRRFIQMFGCVVLNIPHSAFETELTKAKEAQGVTEDAALSWESLQALTVTYKKVYGRFGLTFPSDPYEQLYSAITAVFDSWQSERAIKYRDAEGIHGLLGTAVTVQAMVFGNKGLGSGTGVCFTRNPNTGDEALYGEYLENAQGEDVVAGIRTPLSISTLKDTLPGAYSQLIKNVKALEYRFHDMQDIEFTVEEGKLWMLQTRSGKRTGAAAIKIAISLVLEGLASIDQAIQTVSAEHLKQLLHPQFADTTKPSYTEAVMATGLAASPGAAVGKIVLTPEAAEAAFAAGERVILVREDTSPEDVGGMWAAQGILTASGGMTSHASVVARGWGKPCVCGCPALRLNPSEGTITIAGEVFKEGDWISINGETGEVLRGKQALSPPSFKDNRELSIFMAWVDARRKMKVLANADSPEDALEARRNGAQGIGLTRTEHMFFKEERISVVRRMILTSGERREAAMKELLVFQRGDFEGILEAMDGLPVCVRLLDPPLHEFLPRLHEEDKIAVKSLDQESVFDESFASQMGMSREEVRHAIQELQEVNPMLGLRGCRLGITIPSLTEMQVTALVEAAINNKKRGLSPRFEIMIPLVGSVSEFTSQRALILAAAEKVFAATGERVDFKIGTMIEVPRAALIAKDIAAAGAEFFSFGTNDLTQMTYGFSRDDVGSFLPQYIKQGILDRDPFVVVDQNGVGKLIELSVSGAKEAFVDSASKGRAFKAGVCGEHGGDPTSVKYFNSIGLNYVSCSPFRIPLARLAAAQAVIEQSARE